VWGSGPDGYACALVPRRMQIDQRTEVNAIKAAQREALRQVMLVDIKRDKISGRRYTPYELTMAASPGSDLNYLSFLFGSQEGIEIANKAKADLEAERKKAHDRRMWHKMNNERELDHLGRPLLMGDTGVKRRSIACGGRQ
jgi:hypothetical protein